MSENTAPPLQNETFFGYCAYCGARHEIGGEPELEGAGCMCGGDVIKADVLGRLAHRLWAYWSQAIAAEDHISEERFDRWRKLWVPYEDLDDDAQQTDLDLVETHLRESPEYNR